MVTVVTSTNSSAPPATRVLTNLFLGVNVIILMLAFFALPVLLMWVDENGASGGKYALTPVLLVNPVVFLVLSLLTGRRFGAWAGLFILGALGLLAVSALVVYNDSALVYVLVYLPFALLGWGIGAALRTSRR